MIPDHVFAGIRQRISLSSEVGRWVKLVRNGRNVKGLCPFHTEKTPSFTVDDIKGFYHCFGCGAHGDVIDFIRQKQNLSLMEAVQQLADRAGIAVPVEDTVSHQAQRNATKSLYAVLESACQWFESQLSQNEKALAYLKDRGISETVIQTFRLGWATGHGLIEHCGKMGFSVDLMETAGLIRASQRDQGEFYEWFRQRLIFPIYDDHNRVIAFGGRTLGQAEPKYLNSPETPLFIKGQCVYTNPDKIPFDTAVIVEGYFDVMAVSGVVKGFAPLGTSLTSHQLLKIWKRYNDPIICFDGDVAGEKAALRAALMALPLLSPGKSLSFVQLPLQEDPHSLIHQRGIPVFCSVLKDSIPLSRYLWDKLFGKRESMTPEQKASALEMWRQWVGTIQNADIRKGYQDFFYTASRSAFHKGSPKKKEAVPLSPSVIIHQKVLIGLILLYPDLRDKVHEHLAAMVFPEPNPWLTLRDLMISLYPEFPTEEPIARCLGSRWRQLVSSVLIHVSCEKSLSALEEYWRDLFNSYQTQISQKGEISSLAGQLFQHPENWDRLKALIDS